MEEGKLSNPNYPSIVTREAWKAARKELLQKEKELTRARDRLNTERRNLPMVEIEKNYRFEGGNGWYRLLDLFEGRRQLIVQHFMFDPAWEDGCPSCTAGVDERSDGLYEHLHARETTLATISRAPIEKLIRYKHKKGWEFPWYSSYSSDFNYDFHVTLDEAVTPIEYNYRTKEELKETGFDVEHGQPMEMPGHSFFLRDGDRIFHTYSMYARGAEMLGGSYYFLDLTALGRQESWEEPKGRADQVKSSDPNFLD